MTGSDVGVGLNKKPGNRPSAERKKKRRVQRNEKMKKLNGLKCFEC